MTAGVKKPVTLTPLPRLMVGDKVIRYLCGTIPMPMVVLKVTTELITCGGPDYPGADWEFEPKYGIEHDPDLGLPEGAIISFIVPIPSIEVNQ